jgi:hypothetical protein
LAALDELPDGKILPIVFAFEDVAADKGMGKFVSDSYILGSELPD